MGQSVSQTHHEKQQNQARCRAPFLPFGLAVAIDRPLPLPMDVLLQRVKTAEVRPLRLPTKVNGQIAFTEQTDINWDATGAAGDAPTKGKGHLALLDGHLPILIHIDEY
jgi:hypothetical protein